MILRPIYHGLKTPTHSKGLRTSSSILEHRDIPIHLTPQDE